MAKGKKLSVLISIFIIATILIFIVTYIDFRHTLPSNNSCVEQITIKNYSLSASDDFITLTQQQSEELYNEILKDIHFSGLYLKDGSFQSTNQNVFCLFITTTSSNCTLTISECTDLDYLQGGFFQIKIKHSSDILNKINALLFN